MAAVRDPARAQSLAQKGVIVRQADYSQPETLKAAFEGAEKVLLVSGTEVGGRVRQHQSVVEAARSADVSLLAYTSTLKADTATTILARDHQATEAYIRASGVPYTFLRNGFYVEMRTMSLAAAIEHGVMLGAAKDGRFAAATREDYAAAAVAALTGEGHENKVYELGGDASWTLAEFAAEVARQANSPVIYNDLAPAEYSKILASFGIPEGLALAIADADRGGEFGRA